MDSVNHRTPPLDGAALLRDVTRMYVRAQRRTVSCCGPQSTARCHVLGELARCGPLRLTELADHLDVDKSWASRTVAAMVGEGLLSCSGAEGDGRVVKVAVTRAGRERWGRMDAALRRHAQEALWGLSREERRAVHRGLALLRGVLEDQSRAGAAGPSPGGAARRRRPARQGERRSG